jgi:acetyl-CoA acyltransferase
MREVVIVDAVRTPIAKTSSKTSNFRNVRADELSAIVIDALVKRNHVDPKLIDDVIWGCALAAGENGYDLGRTAAILTGWGLNTPGVQLNRFCSSGLQATQFAISTIMSGYADVIISGGAEHATRVKPATCKDFNPIQAKFMDMDFVNMVWTAEFCARDQKITREQQDEWALNSHLKASKAEKEGLFKREIIPVEVEMPQEDGSTKRILVEKDQGIKHDISMEFLSQLPTVFTDEAATVTAGNASQTNDAAAAVLVMSADKAKELGLKPRLRLISFKAAAIDPKYTMWGPILAIPPALQRAGLTMKDIDIWEVNEAFASQSVLCQRELGYPKDRINMRGSGISLGHPLGCTGARMIATIMNIMDDYDARYGMVAMCASLGQGCAAVFERIK